MAKRVTDFKPGDRVIFTTDSVDNPAGTLGIKLGVTCTVVTDDYSRAIYPELVMIRPDGYESTYYAVPDDLILDEPIPTSPEEIEQWLNN